MKRTELEQLIETIVRKKLNENKPNLNLIPNKILNAILDAGIFEANIVEVKSSNSIYIKLHQHRLLPHHLTAFLKVGLETIASFGQDQFGLFFKKQN